MQDDSNKGIGLVALTCIVGMGALVGIGMFQTLREGRSIWR